MSRDATFEEAQDTPLNIGAVDAEDLRVVATLVQDAVFPVTEIRWQSAKHRLALLLNRFRWEDRSSADHNERSYERVQSLLVFHNVLGVSSQGIDRSDTTLVLSLLDMAWEPGDDGMGELTLVLAGDGAIRLKLEAIDIHLRDVSRPYLARADTAPDHNT